MSETDSMDIYVVVDNRRVVGASARLQGAEVIRADEAKRLTTAKDAATVHRRGTMAGWGMTTPEQMERWFYTSMTITNTTLRYCD